MFAFSWIANNMYLKFRQYSALKRILIKYFFVPSILKNLLNKFHVNMETKNKATNIIPKWCT